MDELRDRGIAAVLENSSDDWRHTYRHLAQVFFSRVRVGDVFSGDQVNEFVESQTDLRPHCPQAKSAGFYRFIRPMLEIGVVAQDGFRKSVRASNHSRYCRTYKRVA